MEFSDAYEAYFERIYRYMYRRVPMIDDAEDLVSDTFMAALASWSTLDTKKEVLPWLYGIASHKLNDFLRKKYAWVETQFDAEVFSLEESSGNDEEGNYRQEKMRKLVVELADSLPEREKLLFQLRFLQNSTHAEVAKKMGITKENAKVMQARLVNKLKELWKTAQINI